jgi:hypothetical protein
LEQVDVDKTIMIILVFGVASPDQPDRTRKFFFRPNCSDQVSINSLSTLI